MSEGHGLTPDQLKQQHSAEITGTTTFRTHGVDDIAAKAYLNTADGTKYLQSLKDADPNAPESRIVDRAMGQIRSGRGLPHLEVIDEPLVKIVRAGDPISMRSPYFARLSE